jgi:hypothetical protein
MALGTDHFVAADLAASIGEVWGVKINDFYRNKLVAASFFTDRSEDVSAGGDIIHTPVIAELAASAKSAQTQVVLADNAQTAVDLTIATHQHVAFMIEDKEAAQVMRQYKTQETYMKNAAYTTAKALDSAITALFTGFSSTAGTTTDALDDAAIHDAIVAYTGNNGDLDEAAWILHSKTVHGDIMSLDKYSLVQNTVSADPSLKGFVGTVYGRPVLVTNNLTKINTNADYAGFFGNPDAIHFATAALPGAKDSMGVRLQAEYKLEWLGVLVVADILFGVIENRDEAGVKIVSAV